MVFSTMDLDAIPEADKLTGAERAMEMPFYYSCPNERILSKYILFSLLSCPLSSTLMNTCSIHHCSRSEPFRLFCQRQYIPEIMLSSPSCPMEGVGPAKYKMV